MRSRRAIETAALRPNNIVFIQLFSNLRIPVSPVTCHNRESRDTEEKGEDTRTDASTQLTIRETKMANEVSDSSPGMVKSPLHAGADDALPLSPAATRGELTHFARAKARWEASRRKRLPTSPVPPPLPAYTPPSSIPYNNTSSSNKQNAVTEQTRILQPRHTAPISSLLNKSAEPTTDAPTGIQSRESDTPSLSLSTVASSALSTSTVFSKPKEFPNKETGIFGSMPKNDVFSFSKPASSPSPFSFSSSGTTSLFGSKSAGTVPLFGVKSTEETIIDQAVTTGPLSFSTSGVLGSSTAPTSSSSPINTIKSDSKPESKGNEHRERLIEFYTNHNPSKLSSVDATLETYLGREAELFQKLENKYSPDGILPPFGEGPTCFMDVSIGDSNGGRMVFQLYLDKTPLAADNFRALCTGEKGMGRSGKPLCYKNATFHRVVPGFVVQGGDFTKVDGTGGESIYPPNSKHGDMWGKFKDETPFMRHSKKGLLSMANSGTNTNGSQFFITLTATPHLNNKHVVFGELIEGMDILDKIAAVQTNTKQNPLPDCIVRINDCGELKDEKEAANNATTVGSSQKDVPSSGILESSNSIKAPPLAASSPAFGFSFTSKTGTVSSIFETLAAKSPSKGNTSNSFSLSSTSNSSETSTKLSGFDFGTASITTAKDVNVQTGSNKTESTAKKSTNDGSYPPMSFAAPTPFSAGKQSSKSGISQSYPSITEKASSKPLTLPFKSPEKVKAQTPFSFTSSSKSSNESNVVSSGFSFGSGRVFNRNAGANSFNSFSSTNPEKSISATNFSSAEKKDDAERNHTIETMPEPDTTAKRTDKNVSTGVASSVDPSMLTKLTKPLILQEEIESKRKKAVTPVVYDDVESLDPEEEKERRDEVRDKIRLAFLRVNNDATSESVDSKEFGNILEAIGSGYDIEKQSTIISMLEVNGRISLTSFENWYMGWLLDDDTDDDTDDESYNDSNVAYPSDESESYDDTNSELLEHEDGESYDDTKHSESDYCGDTHGSDAVTAEDAPSVTISSANERSSRFATSDGAWSYDLCMLWNMADALQCETCKRTRDSCKVKANTSVLTSNIIDSVSNTGTPGFSFQESANSLNEDVRVGEQTTSVSNASLLSHATTTSIEDTTVSALGDSTTTVTIPVPVPDPVPETEHGGKICNSFGLPTY
eukprot:scaffold23104_cov56-Attheya_sp.AAC.5